LTRITKMIMEVVNKKEAPTSDLPVSESLINKNLK
jgi:hypothetical protein